MGLPGCGTGLVSGGPCRSGARRPRCGGSCSAGADSSPPGSGRSASPSHSSAVLKDIESQDVGLLIV